MRFSSVDRTESEEFNVESSCCGKQIFAYAVQLLRISRVLPESRHISLTNLTVAQSLKRLKIVRCESGNEFKLDLNAMSSTPSIATLHYSQSRMLSISNIVGASSNLIYTITCGALVFVLLNLLILVRDRKRNYKKLRDELGLPIPPLSNPIFGHMDELGQRDYEFRWHRDFGKVFAVYNADMPQVKISDSNLINEIFLKQSKLFSSRVWHEHRLHAIKESILLNKGEDWRKIRRIIRPALAEYRIKSNDTHINDIKCGLDKIINRFKSLTSNDGPEQDPSQYSRVGFMAVECADSPSGLALDVNAYDIMQVITLDVIFRLAFNLDSVEVTKGADDENLKLIRSILGCVDSFILKLSAAVPLSRIFTIPFSKYVILHYYRRFIKILVKFNTLSKESKAQKDSAKDAGQPRRIHNILWDEYRAGNLTKREVKANSMAILVAGFETTATTSSYVLWCIAKHVNCKEKLRSDIMNYGLESRYLDMFIKEVMRMYPALPNFVIRTPHEDTKLGGYILKKGMSVYMSVNSIHYDESIWAKPYEFDPERFAEGKTYPPGAYAPFGLGHRMCAGYQLALREMKTIVCELLTNFDVQLIAPSEMITECSTIFLTRPRNEIRVRLIPNVATASSEPPQNVITKPLSSERDQITESGQQQKRQQSAIESDQRSEERGSDHNKGSVSKKPSHETKPISKRASIFASTIKRDPPIMGDEEDIRDVDRDDIGRQSLKEDSVKMTNSVKVSGGVQGRCSLSVHEESEELGGGPDDCVEISRC